MTEQERKTARRSDADRRTEHRRTVHRRKSNVPVEPGEVYPDFDIPLVEFANPALSAVPVVVRLSPHAVVVPVDEKVTKSIVDLLDGVLPAAIKPLVREPNPLHLLLPSDISDPKSVVFPVVEIVIYSISA